jgi:2-haloacid dehalogenase
MVETMDKGTPEVFVFDAYGTLFDVHAAIARHREAAGPEAARCSEIWRTKQLEYTWTLTLAGRYCDFWTLTERALDYALARVPDVPRTLRPQLLDAYRSLDAFADVTDVLAALKARGKRTAILSNGTRTMVDAAIAASGIGGMLDDVFTVDTIRTYKPRPETYALVTNAWRIEPKKVHFVSSNRWDIMGAASFGFRTLWLNRSGTPDEYSEIEPERVVRDLTSVPAFAG